MTYCPGQKRRFSPNGRNCNSTIVGVRRILSVRTNGTNSRGGNSFCSASIVPNSMSRLGLRGLAMHMRP